MNLLASLRTALRALRKNKLRSLLAMLGIVIAVGAVVATVAIGQGAQAKVAAQMASLGSNLLMVIPGSIASHGVATGADQLLRRPVRGPQRLSPIVLLAARPAPQTPVHRAEWNRRRRTLPPHPLPLAGHRDGRRGSGPGARFLRCAPGR